MYFVKTYFEVYIKFSKSICVFANETTKESDVLFILIFILKVLCMAKTFFSHFSKPCEMFTKYTL